MLGQTACGDRGKVSEGKWMLISKMIMKTIRRVTAGSCAWVFAVLLCVSGNSLESYAAGSSVIENLTVTFTTTYGGAGEIPDPEIKVSGDGCLLGDVQYRTDYEKWKPGKKVRIEVNVNADEGKVFPVSLTRTQCKVSGADFVSAKALDDGTMQVKVDYVPVMVLGDTENAGWSDRNHKRAVWKSVEYAPGYTLVLYDGDKVVKRMNVETNSVDLSDSMKDDDVTYYYEVKAVPLTSEEKKYLKEGNFVPSTGQEISWEDSESSPPGDGGAVRGTQYVLPNGTVQTNMWKKVGSDWYYFGADGNMVKGWQVINGYWYYMDAAGKMQTGWVSPDGISWYYLYESGGMGIGWIQAEPGIWYYADASGRMQTGWVPVNGKWYYMNPDGRMHTGWLTDNGLLYYLYGDGVMATDAVVDGHLIGANGVAMW